MRHTHRFSGPRLSDCFLAGMIAFAVGCAGPRKTAPTVDAAGLSDEAFQMYLAQVDLVTVDEAYRAMLILADGECKAKTFAERKNQLESQGISRGSWKLQQDNVIDCGSIAFMVCRICQIKGGIDMHLLGSWGLGDRRYAMRELVYREMSEDAVDYQYMTGARLVGLLAKADQVMAQKNLYPNQGIDLSDEKDRDEKGDLIVPKTNMEKSP
ncbi:MAG: hypothetical protein AABZ08_08650 [Planctomycetota bacterium]